MIEVESMNWPTVPKPDVGLSAERPCRVIAVTSGKGGVGKSNLAVNLGVVMAARGLKVLVMDTDVGLGNVDVLLDQVAAATLEDVARGQRSINEAIYRVSPRLFVLSAGTPRGTEGSWTEKERGQVLAAFDALSERFDVVLVDTPSGIGDNALFFAAVASEVLVVATPEPTAVADAYATIKWLAVRYGVNRVGVVANRVCAPVDAAFLYNRLSGVVGRFLPVVADFLGQIPEDERLRHAVVQQSPVASLFPDAASSRAIQRLAVALLARNVPKPAGRLELLWRQRLGAEAGAPTTAAHAEWA